MATRGLPTKYWYCWTTRGAVVGCTVWLTVIILATRVTCFWSKLATMPEHLQWGGSMPQKSQHRENTQQATWKAKKEQDEEKKIGIEFPRDERWFQLQNNSEDSKVSAVPWRRCKQAYSSRLASITLTSCCTSNWLVRQSLHILTLENRENTPNKLCHVTVSLKFSDFSWMGLM